MTSHYTASELIEAYKAFQRAEAMLMARRPAGVSCGGWRIQNASDLPPIYFSAKEGRVKRSLTWPVNGNPYDLWVWSVGPRCRIVEQIDLSAPDADQRLARYTRRAYRDGTQEPIEEHA